jgi:hypothetical protein
MTRVISLIANFTEPYSLCLIDVIPVAWRWHLELHNAESVCDLCTLRIPRLEHDKLSLPPGHCLETII